MARRFNAGATWSELRDRVGLQDAPSVPPVTPPPGASETDIAILQRLAEIEAATRRAVPRELVWGIYPGDGTSEPIPAGQTTFDFEAGMVEIATGNRSLNIPREALDRAQSWVIAIDQAVSLRVEPGFGTIQLSPGVLEAGSRNATKFVFTAEAPFLLQLALSTGTSAADFRPQGWWQWRYHASTITKVAAAGNADSFVAVPFTVREGAKTLAQAQFGSTLLVSAGYAQRVFTVRNSGPGDINVRIVGSVLPVVGLTSGFIEDPDAGEVDIPSGESAVLETGLPWGAMNFEARVDEAEAAAVDADIEVEYIGMSYVAR